MTENPERSRREQVLLKPVLALAAAMLIGALTAGPAFAAHCTPADKKDDAGAVGLEDLFVAGSSDNLIAPGAFVDGDEIGPGVPDLFIRGPEPLPGEAPPITGGGSLPAEAHDNGSPDHGVVDAFGG